MNETFWALEKNLDVISEKLPRLPKEVQDLLVTVIPWLVIIGIIGWVFWLIDFISNYFLQIDYFRNLEFYTPYAVAPNGLALMTWVYVIFLVITLIFLIRAVRGLLDKKRSGWKWLFYAIVFALIGSLLTINFWAFIGWIIALYLVFQAKDRYLPV